MRSPPADDPRLARAAAAGLLLVLVVVVVSAAIRLEVGATGPLRVAHRLAASLEVLVALWLAWLAWSRRRERPWALSAATVVAALTIFLSILGIAGGQEPPRPIALGNLLGGLALAAAFAWLLGRAGTDSGRRDRSLLPVIAVVGILLALQGVTGARVAIVARYELPALPAHAMLGLALAALLGWLALARVRGRRGRLLFGLALLAPVAGFTALHLEQSATAALAHATVAALLVAFAARALARNA